jgi:hypothetical protein
MDRKSFIYDPLKVVVGTGPEEQTFYINKDLICNKSKFFEVACKQEWSTERQNTVALDEDKPQIFGIFLAWLTTGDLEQSADVIPLDETCLKNCTDKAKCLQVARGQFELLCRCFVLGDSLQSTKFCDCVMDRIVDLSSQTSQNVNKILCTRPEATKFIYRHTTSNSPLRQYCLDIWLSGALSLDWIMDNIKKLTGNDFSDFLADLLPRLFAINECKKHYLNEFPRVLP